MESQPQNPEFRNNPENFHPCLLTYKQVQIGRRVPYSMDLRNTTLSALLTFTTMAWPYSRAICELISSNVISVGKSHRRGSVWKTVRLAPVHKTIFHQCVIS